MRGFFVALAWCLPSVVDAAAACQPGAAVEIAWNGTWWPGKVKQGPDESGRCYVSYDNYDSTWDAWMKPSDLRSPQGAQSQSAPAPAAVAVAAPKPKPTSRAQPVVKPVVFVPKRDECTVGERVMTRDGKVGTVTSVGQTGTCFVDLDDGGRWASVPSQFHSLSNNQGLVQGAPPMTVYMCNSPEIMIRADVSFSLRPGQQYVHFDGKRGQYRYDAGSATLQMLSGPLSGFSYSRFSETAFSLVMDGQPSNVSCVSNPAKNADRPPW